MGSRQLEKVADAPVTAREERLERGLARILVEHAHVREAAHATLDDLELRLERLGAVEGRPLERRPRLGNERRDRQGEPPERPTGRVEDAQPLEHASGQIRNRLDVLGGLGRLADHEVGLQIWDAVSPDKVAGGHQLVVADGLADATPQPLGPRLGRHRERAVAAPRQRRHQPLAQTVGAKRRDRELHPVVLDDLEEIAEPRIVRHAGADEADAALAAGRHPLHGLAQGVDAAMPDWTVHLALETEAAAAPAALAHLEERHVTVLGLRCLHRGDRLEGVHVPQAALGDDRGRAVSRDDVGDGPVDRVRDLVSLGHVHAIEARERGQQASAVAVARAVRADQLDDQFFALADDHEVHEGRDRLRIRERADAAHQDQRIVRPSRGGAQRDPRHAEQAQDVDVVAFVGDREADEVELGERPERFERERRHLRPLHLVEVGRLRHEHALADHVGHRVQVPINGLEAEIRHADGVRIGIDEGDGDLAAPVLDDGSLLLGEQGLCFLLQ